MAEIKKIQFNPIKSDGTKDTDTILHPETEIDSVVGLTEELEGKVSNTDYLENLKYGVKDKTIVIPAIIEDNTEYTLPTEYDMSKLEFPTGEDPNMLYYDEGNVQLFLGNNNGVNFINIIYPNEEENYPQYIFANIPEMGAQWFYLDDTMDNPEPYTQDVKITIHTDFIIEGKERLF